MSHSVTDVPSISPQYDLLTNGRPRQLRRSFERIEFLLFPFRDFEFGFDRMSHRCLPSVYEKPIPSLAGYQSSAKEPRSVAPLARDGLHPPLARRYWLGDTDTSKSDGDQRERRR